MSQFKGRTRCESVRDSLSDFLEGRLSAALRGPLRAHLQRCPSCRTAHDRERWIRLMLSELPGAETPAALEDRVLAAVFSQVPLRERVAPRTAPSCIRRQWALLPVALMLLALVLSKGFNPIDPNTLRDTATQALVEGGRELSGALIGIEAARQTGEQITRPALDKAASLIRVERTLMSVLPGSWLALILLVAASPIVLVFTVYRFKLKGALSHVLVHPALR